MWSGYADEAFALADEATDPDYLARAWSARAAVLHFRGDFEAAADEWLRGAATGTTEAVRSRARPRSRRRTTADLERARCLLDRARELMAPIGSLSQHAYLAYVEGEWRAPTSIDDAMPYYREAIDLASRAGTGFVEGVARVSLVAAQRRDGDIAGAAAGYGDAAARRGGVPATTPSSGPPPATPPSCWPRRVAWRPAALLLICAEDAPGVAAVGPEIARFSARVFVRLSDLVEASDLDRLRAEAARLGASAVLDRAEAELREVAAGGDLIAG